MKPKKKIIFYLHEGVGAYVLLESLDDLEFYLDGLSDGYNQKVEFRARYMTDEELDNLEEI